MSAPAAILDLVARFEQQLESYKSGQYNETQVRREFLDPLFKALGWDINNVQGFAEAYKDVIHEDQIRIAGATKAPDYCFRVGGTRKFFLEAKKPSVVIKDEPAPAYQLRRYAWSAKLPLSILSDFEEFAVYDGRFQPRKDDTASAARIFYCTFRDYAEKWDWISERFSHDAILKGAFDRFAESTRAKRGTTEVDSAFLAEIENWRGELAKNLALRNPKLTQRQLNFAVQRIIDRIIFLRICEDRGIEDHGRLRALINGDRIYRRLAGLFEQADVRYNSGLFHFKHEPGRHEDPDELTLELDVDDKLLRDIFRRLYYPDSPYEFSVISADILGQVYEQFLGKVIRLTEGHRAIIDDKPEVKKTGGVYYTPTHIVEYIVRQTVGRLLDECSGHQGAISSGGDAGRFQALLPAKPLEPRRAGTILNRVSRLRILDPACGSGSFLIGAYQCLLDWHLQFYLANDPVRWARGSHPALVQTARRTLDTPEAQPVRNWRLTIGERKRILLNNIFGVDIDSQAVEVTKLSLLLKVLEGETQQTLEPLFRLFHERALPDLGDNIKCGNSLIGPDFYQQSELPLLTEEERYRINVFDWKGKDGFPGIMEAGGFDAVIGNPPYGATLTKAEEDFLRLKFKTATRDLDTYTLFMEQAVGLSKSKARFSMIVPTGWYSGPKFSPLRRFIAVQTDPESLVNLPYDIFKAWVDTTVFVVVKRTKASPWPRSDRCSVKIITFPKRYRILTSKEFDQGGNIALFSDWFADGFDEYLSYADAASTKIMRKLLARSTPLGELADVQRGVTPFHLTETRTHAMSRVAFGGTVRRYRLERGKRLYVRFDDSLAELKPERYFVGPRLLVRELISRQFQLQAVKVTENFVTNKSMQSVLALPAKVELNFLLGVINSRLMSWYFLRKSNVAQRDDFPKIVLKETRALPVPRVDPRNTTEKGAHDRIVKLVEAMLELHRQLAGARTPQERTVLERQIAATDADIDRLVYELYGLTEEEIKIVEGKADATAGAVPARTAPVETGPKPKRARLKSSYAAPPPGPAQPGITPEKAWGDAAHHYGDGKEQAPPYQTKGDRG